MNARATATNILLITICLLIIKITATVTNAVIITIITIIIIITNHGGRSSLSSVLLSRSIFIFIITSVIRERRVAGNEGGSVKKKRGKERERERERERKVAFIKVARITAPPRSLITYRLISRRSLPTSLLWTWTTDSWRHRQNTTLSHATKARVANKYSRSAVSAVKFDELCISISATGRLSAWRMSRRPRERIDRFRLLRSQPLLSSQSAPALCRYGHTFSKQWDFHATGNFTL